MKGQQLVPFLELQTAYNRWEVANPEATEPHYSNPPRTQHPWMKFLGVHKLQRSLMPEFEVRPNHVTGAYWVPGKGALRVRGLNGPHWETLLKVWAIQDASKETANE